MNSVLCHLLISLALFLGSPIHPLPQIQLLLQAFGITPWSTSFVLKVFLSFSLTHSMDLIFMTCQPFKLNTVKTKVFILLTSRPQVNNNQVILLALSKLSVAIYLLCNKSLTPLSDIENPPLSNLSFFSTHIFHCSSICGWLKLVNILLFLEHALTF